MSCALGRFTQFAYNPPLDIQRLGYLSGKSIEKGQTLPGLPVSPGMRQLFVQGKGLLKLTESKQPLSLMNQGVRGLWSGRHGIGSRRTRDDTRFRRRAHPGLIGRIAWPGSVFRRGFGWTLRKTEDGTGEVP